jgi:hypothetical protein
MNIKESMELIFESVASISPTTIISLKLRCLSTSVLYLSQIWIHKNSIPIQEESVFDTYLGVSEEEGRIW